MNELEFYLKRLGLRVGATLEDVQRAYRTLAWKWHPDRLPFEQRERGTLELQELNEARHWLQRHARLLAIARSLRARSVRCPRCGQRDSYREQPLGQEWKCRVCGADFTIAPGVEAQVVGEHGGRTRGWSSVAAVCLALLLFGVWLGDGHHAVLGVVRELASPLGQSRARRAQLAQPVAQRPPDRRTASVVADERAGREAVRGVAAAAYTTEAFRPSTLAPAGAYQGDAAAAVTILTDEADADRLLRSRLDAMAKRDASALGLPPPPRGERDATQSECWHAGTRNSAGAYDACVRRRLRALTPRGKRPPALSAVTPSQRKAIEDACWNVQVKKGGGCIRRDLAQLVPQSRRAEVAALEPSQRNRIEAVCWSATVGNGTAATRACIKRELDQIARAKRPRPHLAAAPTTARRNLTARERANWHKANKPLR